MHLRGCRAADRLADQAFDPCPQRQMLASSIHKVRGRTVDQVNRFRSHSCAVEANLSASNLPGAAYKQHPQSTRRNNFPGEQIPEWYLLLSKNLSASNYPGAANTGGNAELRCIVFEPMAWKTARFRAAQAGPYRSTATIYKC